MSDTTQKPVTFISKYRNLRIVRKASYSKEVEGRRVTLPGTAIRFAEGAFTTSEPEEIKFIESRPEFGRHIQRVPDNVEDLAAARVEMNKDLEQREADIKAREEALAAREAELSSNETGKDEDEDEDGEEEGAKLESLDRPALLEELKVAKEADPEFFKDLNGNSKSEDIIAALREKRKDDDTPAFNE